MKRFKKGGFYRYQYEEYDIILQYIKREYGQLYPNYKTNSALFRIVMSNVDYPSWQVGSCITLVVVSEHSYHPRWTVECITSLEN